jgi:galactose mutarotase-like enzyme
MTGNAFTLQSEGIRVVVVPETGAQITSLMDSDGHEYLASGFYPRPDNLDLYAPFNDGGLGGIDDCLPAVGADVYPGGPYGGWKIPDHGEVWQRPWQVVESSPNELVVSIEGARLPYTFVRRMTVHDAALDIDYQLINHGENDLPIVWASHPLFVPTPNMTIVFAHQGYLKVEACNMGFEQDAQIDYPILKVRGGEVDLRRWDSLPLGFFLKAFSPLPPGAPVVLGHIEWGRSLEIVTTAQTLIHLGLWLNRGGFPSEQPVEHFSIEPTFGSADALTRAMKDNSCLTLKANSDERWRLSYRILHRL